jgi:hypothetical protein
MAKSKIIAQLNRRWASKVLVLSIVLSIFPPLLVIDAWSANRGLVTGVSATIFIAIALVFGFRLVAVGYFALYSWMVKRGSAIYIERQRLVFLALAFISVATSKITSVEVLQRNINGKLEVGLVVNTESGKLKYMSSKVFLGDIQEVARLVRVALAS